MFRTATTRAALVLATSLRILSGCGHDQSVDSKFDTGTSERQPKRFVLETVTTCRAGGHTGVDRGLMVVDISDKTVTIGLEDEVLAGIPIPIAFDEHEFELGGLTIPTSEEFGEVRLHSFNGSLDTDSLRLFYEFEVLDVCCATAGTGTEFE
jgi:hypothetical protein